MYRLLTAGLPPAVRRMLMKLGPAGGKGGAVALVQQWEFNAAKKDRNKKAKDFRKDCLDGIDKMHLKGHAKELMKNAVYEILPKSVGNMSLGDLIQI
jgi:hypothetical protein